MNVTTILDVMPARNGWAISSVLTLGIASAVGLGLAYVVPGGAAAAVTEAPAPIAAPAVPVWTVVDDLSGASCEARPGPRLSGTAHAVDLGAGCVAVAERLAEAVVWNEGRDGTVSLADATGRLVVAFAPAEGDALEAYAPAHMMLSLARE